MNPQRPRQSPSEPGSAVRAYADSCTTANQLQLRLLTLLGSEHEDDSCEGPKKPLSSQKVLDISTSSGMFPLKPAKMMLPGLQTPPLLAAFADCAQREVQTHVPASHWMFPSQNRGPKRPLRDEHILFTESNPS